jgi:isopenicillin-N N-acyltransferase-like protein
MTARPLKLISLTSLDPLARGHVHGELLREQINEIAEIRLERVCSLPPYKKVKEVLALAEDHLQIFNEYDVDLFLEFRGISEGSNLSLAKLLILNHYTDIRDITIKSVYEDIGGCSIIYSPTGIAPILGQTWDIHGSAEPYVILLKLKESMVFSITGCLGMTGLNKYGVGIAINNLSSVDAKVGVMWPAIIRKALTRKSAKEAKEEIMAANLGSGRHFAIADGQEFYSIEASGIKKKLVWDNPKELYFHTNHCLDAEMRQTHFITKESTTYYRYQQLDDVIRYQDLTSAENVFLALAGVGLPQDKNEPHKTATCGTLVMDLKNRFVLGCQGIPNADLLTSHDVKVKL